MDARLARAVREVRADLPIVLCTAIAQRADKTAGFDAVVAKPVDTGRLLEASLAALRGAATDEDLS